jgi:UDP-2,4-diacetamido-2,4,6-trideoxy-beta-L-altropyranose hydrolase
MTEIVSGIFIRADASPRMGTGHVMRCLALARAAGLEAGLDVRIIARPGVAWVRERLALEKAAVTEIPGEVPVRERPEDLLAQLEDAGEQFGKRDWVVLDGYHFGPDCHQAVRGAGYKLLVIDDYAHLPEYSCDVLFNQNIGAETLSYKGAIGQVLLGPKYALLRPEFIAARKRAEERSLPERVQNILLTLGGGNFVECLARMAPEFSIPRLAGRALRVIAGAMPLERIHELLKDCPAKLEILERVDDMPALLLATDLCVSAGGSTCWELCCLGVPFLTVETAENQRAGVRELEAKGVAPVFASSGFSALLLDGAARRKRAGAGLALVDGLGAGRAVRAMTELS